MSQNESTISKLSDSASANPASSAGTIIGVGRLVEVLELDLHAAEHWSHGRIGCRPSGMRMAQASHTLRAVFDSLSDRLNATLTDLRSRGRLSEEDVAVAMREIRLALLEADVNFKVVREFVAKVRERAVGEGVLTGPEPRPAGRSRS